VWLWRLGLYLIEYVRELTELRKKTFVGDHVLDRGDDTVSPN
jgi:hypothetical protein